MANEKNANADPNSADGSAGDQISAKQGFEMPECCRQMMTQMMGGSFRNFAERGDGQSAEDAPDSPGIFARLLGRMMKACCGGSTAERNRSTQV